MTLLELDPDGLSLEFQPTEFPAIMAALRAQAGRRRVRRQPGVTFDTLTVAGHRLLLMDEWDEPCLISADDGGARLLRHVKEVADGGESRASRRRPPRRNIAR